jgi:two-component system, NarL family, nitrate/nitrite response regulator NarL
MTIRLVLADDHPIVLLGLEQLFAAEHDCEVAACAVDGDEAIRAMDRHRPDVLVLDLRMPGTDGLAVLTHMQQHPTVTRAVVLSAAADDDLFEAIRLGARGVLLKDMASTLLLRCVRTVHSGGKWIEKTVAASSVDRLLRRDAGIHALAHNLTPRELQVARMIAAGLPSKVVAARLAITEGTAKLHLHHIYEKLDLDGRVGLVQYMRRRDLDRD